MAQQEHTGQVFLDTLEAVRFQKPTLISADVDIPEDYGVLRSFGKGADSEAANRGTSTVVIELNGCWRKKFQSGASYPNITIRKHYTNVWLVLDKLLEFSGFL